VRERKGFALLGQTGVHLLSLFLLFPLCGVLCLMEFAKGFIMFIIFSELLQTIGFFFFSFHFGEI
jgi:hypothetical protein